MLIDTSIAAGTTIIRDDGLVFKTLDDSTAHGCPMVLIIRSSTDSPKNLSPWRKGDKTHMTLYLHLDNERMRIVDP